MKYHAVFFDKTGTPYLTAQDEDRDRATEMMHRHIGKKKAEYVVEFRVSDEHIVVIFKEMR